METGAPGGLGDNVPEHVEEGFSLPIATAMTLLPETVVDTAQGSVQSTDPVTSTHVHQMVRTFPQLDKISRKRHNGWN